MKRKHGRIREKFNKKASKIVNNISIKLEDFQKTTKTLATGEKVTKR